MLTAFVMHCDACAARACAWCAIYAGLARRARVKLNMYTPFVSVVSVSLCVYTVC